MNNTITNASDTPQGGKQQPVAPLTLQLRRIRRNTWLRIIYVTGALIGTAVVLTFADLMFGHDVYRLDDVVAVISGRDVPGLSFIIGSLRLPRVLIGVLSGFAFGMAGSCFQHLLGNVLASPDVIGITAGANTTAVFAIIILGWSGMPLAGAAICGGLLTAAAVLALSWHGSFSSNRLILIGIGIAAALNALSSWLLVRADQWDIQTASRWLTGSLASASWMDVGPLAVCVLVVGPALQVLEYHIDALRLGTTMARGLGVRTNRVQGLTIVLAVFMLSVATSISGPIAFVSFLAGPIARHLTGPSRPNLLQAGLCGSCIVLLADIVAQHIPPTQLPVGIITSVIGGPMLMLLMIRNAQGKESR